MAACRLFAVLILAASTGAAALPDPGGVERRVFDDTNAFRRGEGRAPLRRDARLEAAAHGFAAFMAKTERYGHEADGSTPDRRARARGYDYCIVSENISYQFDSRGYSEAQLAQHLFEGWRDSPPHRRNMLDPAATDTAVAVARGERNGYFYGVQMFGRPRSRALHFQVRNRAGATASYRVDDETFRLAPGGIRSHVTCREEALALEGASGAGASLTPRDGDRVAVVGAKGAISLRRE